MLGQLSLCVCVPVYECMCMNRMCEHASIWMRLWIGAYKCPGFVLEQTWDLYEYVYKCLNVWMCMWMWMSIKLFVNKLKAHGWRCVLVCCKMSNEFVVGNKLGTHTWEWLLCLLCWMMISWGGRCLWGMYDSNVSIWVRWCCLSVGNVSIKLVHVNIESVRREEVRK